MASLLGCGDDTSSGDAGDAGDASSDSGNDGGDAEDAATDASEDATDADADAADAGEDATDTGEDAADAGEDAGGDSADADEDAGPGSCAPPTDLLDLLFVVDNSNSMFEEQASLVDGLDTLFDELAERGLDVRVGIITSDMGIGMSIFTCESERGDDGVLRRAGNTDITGCDEVYPRFIDFDAESAETASADVACVAQIGTGGCGFEQPLEAVLKAVTPATSDIRFQGDTTGHGDGLNTGLVRDDAALAVVLVTDENDCSASDLELFDPESETYDSPELNLRCFIYPDALHPVNRYVEGLMELKGDARRIAFVSIAGIPVDLATSEVPVFADILTDPRMEERPNPENPTQLTPSCNVAGRGLAFPPRRLVEVAQDASEAGIQVGLRSICEDFSLEGLIPTLERATGRCE